MIKVLFVCLGNICRSPMAEFIFKDMVKKKGMEKEFFIDSAATSGHNEMEKAGIYGEAKEMLREQGISFTEHISRQIRKEDYNRFDYIVGMDAENIKNILRIVGKDKENKVCRLLDFTEMKKDVDDPWYSGDFYTAYCDIEYGCEKFLEYVCKK